MGVDISFAETVEQYGPGGFLVFLLMSGAIAAAGKSVVGLIQAKIRKEKGLVLWFQPVVTIAVACALGGYAVHMIRSKSDNLRQAASLLDGKWAPAGDCRYAIEYHVDVATATLSALQPDQFTLIFEIDYVRSPFVQAHARGGGEFRVFERKDDILSQRNFDGQKMSFTRC